jgi:hypothetical protein
VIARGVRRVLGIMMLLSLSGCCCDVLVFLPIREVRATPGAPSASPPALSRTLLLDGARAAAVTSAASTEGAAR